MATVRLTWTAAETVRAEYEVYKVFRRDGAGSFELLTTIEVDWEGMEEYAIVPPSTYDDTTAEPEHTYTYRVTAYDHYNRQISSNTFTIEIPEPIPVEPSFAVVMDGAQPFSWLKLVPPPAPLSDYTLTGWALLTPDVGSFTGRFVRLDGSDESSSLGVEYDFASAVSFRLRVSNGEGSTNSALTPPSEAEWFFFALTFSSDTELWTASWALVNSDELEDAVTNARPAFMTNDVSQLNAGYFVLDGRSGAVTQFRQWLRVLTDEELIAEKNSRTAVLQTDLFSDNPMQGGADFSDASENGREWLSFEDHASTAGPANG